MSIPRQFMDNTCEIMVKISCEVAFLGGIVEQLQKENQELKDQLQGGDKPVGVSPLKNGAIDNAERTRI